MSRRWKSWMRIVGVRMHSHRCHVRSRQEERRKEEEGFIFGRSLTGMGRTLVTRTESWLLCMVRCQVGEFDAIWDKCLFEHCRGYR